MRVILHSDLNNFYASCECLLNPEYIGKPLVVCGKIEDRHGIVLAKNQIAKDGGVKTGMTLYECRKLFPDIITVVANHDLYLKYSRKVKSIYKEYTDRVESFGIDEAWLDVTESVKRYGNGQVIADEIRRRVKEEIGLTVSIGVSFNKVFAKLGSDLKKPDAVTVIDKINYKKLIWGLPVEDLLFVGRATKRKLNDLGIKTIGGLAEFDVNVLKFKFGKVGEKLWMYANGLDMEPVKRCIDDDEIKSVGNSLTFYKDLYNISDVEMLFYYLAESVSERMKNYKLPYAKTVHITVINKDLEHFAFQCALPFQTSASNVIAESAINLFLKHINPQMGIRGVGVTVTNFVDSEQLIIGEAQNQKDKNVKIDETMEYLRNRFGHKTIDRALITKDDRLRNISPAKESINTKNC